LTLVWAETEEKATTTVTRINARKTTETQRILTSAGGERDSALYSAHVNSRARRPVRIVGGE